jgi:NAD(P)-dependent dehydrogenase (short-subunit alcohol dehydrogenase family)
VTEKQWPQDSSKDMENENMTSDTNADSTNLDRRHFLRTGAAGIAAVGATAGMGINTVQAENKAPGAKLRTNSKTGIRTAVITDAQLNIGPFLAQEMAKLNYNLVLADVQKGLPEKLRQLGASKVVVVPGLEQDGPNNEGKPGSLQKVVDVAMEEFGGFDSAFIRTAIHAPAGDILNTTTEGMLAHYQENFLAAMYGLQAVLPPLMEAGGGQVVVQTSATGEKPQPTMMAYSAMRAATGMMCRCAAMTAAPNNVCVNVVGTNFMNYPGFRHAAGAQDPAVFQRILDEIPVGRLGETAEAAHFTLALLDGHNMYMTGNFFPVAGGFNNMGMKPFK